MKHYPVISPHLYLFIIKHMRKDHYIPLFDIYILTPFQIFNDKKIHLQVCLPGCFFCWNSEFPVPLHSQTEPPSQVCRIRPREMAGDGIRPGVKSPRVLQTHVGILWILSSYTRIPIRVCYTFPTLSSSAVWQKKPWTYTESDEVQGAWWRQTKTHR